MRVALAAILAGGLLVVAIGALLPADEDESSPVAIVPSPQGPFKGGRLPDGLRGKQAFAFELADARGGTTGTAQVAGKPYALTFLYVNCPDVCPLIGGELRRALELLGPGAGDVAVLAVSVDPKRDTPAAVREWLEQHRLPRNFHYLLGRRAELKPVWDAYYAAPQIPGRADSAHTASIWLIDSRGRIRTKFSGGVPVPPRDIAHDLRLLLREQATGRAAEVGRCPSCTGVD